MSAIGDFFTNNKNEIIAGVIILALLGVLYFYMTKGEEGGEGVGTGLKVGSFLTTAVIGILVVVAGYLIYTYTLGDSTSSGNLSSTPVTSSNPQTVSSTQTPTAAGPDGGSYGILYWMYIQDWNYKFGETKSVIVRSAGGDSNPNITLHPTENSLQVTVSMFPSSTSGSSSSSEPAPSNNDGSSTDSTYTCTVTDVPLQSWFCVGVSLSGRSLDVYLNGKMVRSCFLPGVPKPVSADLQIMPNGGFSGKVIDVYHYSRALLPSDVASFCAKGTNGTNYTSQSLPSKGLFGYKVDVGVFNPSGTEVKKFVL
jgi:hypothetical protein